MHPGLRSCDKQKQSSTFGSIFVSGLCMHKVILFSARFSFNFCFWSLASSKNISFEGTLKVGRFIITTGEILQCRVCDNADKPYFKISQLLFHFKTFFVCQIYSYKKVAKVREVREHNVCFLVTEFFQAPIFDVLTMYVKLTGLFRNNEFLQLYSK